MNKNLGYAVSNSFFGREEVGLLASEFERAFNENHGQKIFENIV